MSTIATPDGSQATSSRSASALNLIGGTWVVGLAKTSRDICNPADAAEVLAPVREAAPEQVNAASLPPPVLSRAGAPLRRRSGLMFCSSSGACWKRTSRTWHTAASAKTTSC